MSYHNSSTIDYRKNRKFGKTFATLTQETVNTFLIDSRKSDYKIL